MGSSAANATSLSWLSEASLRLRSVTPGRQRWELPVLLGRPNLAQVVERSLRTAPEIEDVKANPTTGRLLVFHDPSLSAQSAAQLLRRKVVQTLTEVAFRLRPEVNGGQQRTSEPPPPSAQDGTTVMAVGATAGAAALGVAKFGLGFLTWPWVSLGLMAVATTGVVKRALRRSPGNSRSDAETSTAAEGVSRRHVLTRLIGRHRLKFGIATALSVLTQAAELGLFALVSYSVAVLFKGGSTTLAGLGVIGLGTQLSVLAGATALTALVTTGTSWAANVTWNRLGQAVEHEWRTTTYAHVQRLSAADLESEHTSGITRAVTEDIGQIGSFIRRTLPEIVQLASCFAVLCPAFLLLAPQLAWVAFAPVPLVAWVSFRFHERAAARHRDSAAAQARLYAKLGENIQASTTVKAACTEEYEDQRVVHLSTEHSSAGQKTENGGALQAQVLRLCAMAVLPATLWLGGKAVLRGELALTTFAPLVDMPAFALSRLHRLGSLTEDYQLTLTAFDRVERLRAMPREPDEGRKDLPVATSPAAIELRSVTYAYPGRPPVLHDLSMQLAPGQVTGIVGTSGAGKTTVAKLLMRFVEPSSGEVLMAGTDVREMPLSAVRGSIGYVSQEPFLFDGTIADNIRYGTFDATDRSVAEAARVAGADMFIEALPDGYDTTVGERGAGLSGGQKQRIALARTVLRNPPVVILDEATSAVDNETEAIIQRGLAAFARTRTLIVIAHRLSTIRNADMIYVLERGGVVAERGTHTELLGHKGRYANMWHLQSGGTPLERPRQEALQVPA